MRTDEVAAAAASSAVFDRHFQSGRIITEWRMKHNWGREGREPSPLPDHDLGAQYQARLCGSREISKLQRAKWGGSKSAAICTVPNCVYL